MSYRIASIGDKVKYREVEVEVTDVSFLGDVDGLIDPKTSNANGDLHYKIDNVEFGEQWVEASECELEEPTDKDSFFEQDSRSIHLQELGYDMLRWSEGLEERPDNSNLPPIVTLLMAIQYDKEGGYGSSWKGKGEYRGIMANIDRKYDRLDKMTQDEISGIRKSLEEQERMLEQNYDLYSQEVGESKIDAIADQANYLLLYMTYVRKHFPNVFKVWVEHNVPGYLRDKIPFV